MRRAAIVQFFVETTVYATPNALRRRLQKCEEVQKAKAALASGIISEETIERFVTWIMRDLERGKKFQHQTALSAIVVILEDRQTTFAESLIKELSELQAVEISLSAGVAKEAANNRKNQALNSMRNEVTLTLSLPWGGEALPIIIPDARNPKSLSHKWHHAAVR